jgi:hypothetical protein
MIGAIMDKKYGEFVFKKKDLEIVSNDGTRYFINPEKDVCLYKIPYRPDGEGEEFYMDETESHRRKYTNKTLVLFSRKHIGST